MLISTAIGNFTGFSVSPIQITGANRLKIQNNFLKVIDSVEAICGKRKGRIGKNIYCLICALSTVRRWKALRSLD
jgi:hypothetical protein